MSTYDTFDEFNADVKKAREAYERDQLVREGSCEMDCGRNKDQHHRKCRTCRRRAAAGGPR